ncbi:hypothetical protein BC939DRAFT_435461 [Gamsiella multidivaricata]|uniref:uncharacterized protein n=1 Tax=Gamsiella multidivaricata TaxID=101098 RepID=UPI00221F21CF|nr:uncharacterized protein BC939DRAFT_435461 [Gamsiella multidivaricata]KAI7832423.1 hypothetical protein BC939DRAFT_435461 [Gamsiella multidivaricata]
MSKFYTPMNPTYIPQPPAPIPIPRSQLPSQPQQTPYTTALANQTAGPSIGANAALLLANLTTIPGFLSEAAIQEARLEYSKKQSITPFTAPVLSSYSHEHAPNLVSQPFQSHPTQYHQVPVQGYHSDAPLPHPDSNPQTASSANTSSDRNASIGVLLKELQQSESPSSSKPLAAPTSSLPTTMPAPAPSLPKPLPEPQTPEDYSSGKITPQLLKRLAAISENDAQQGGTLLNEIKRLKERQLKTERSLFESRQAVLARQKQELVKLQASEIMGVDITSQLRKIKAEHHAELKQFDKNVIRQMDREIANAQGGLAKAGVPMMLQTQDPVMIAAQIKVLRLLEDMLQT